MIDDLMRNPSIVLQNVIVFKTLGNRNLLRDRQHLAELIVRDIVKLRAVVFRDNELSIQNLISICSCRASTLYASPTECPLLKGPMSKKANILSLSKILNEGISPGIWY
jgi:hypothetical protein